jgi:hypothetical protein
LWQFYAKIPWNAPLEKSSKQFLADFSFSMTGNSYLIIDKNQPQKWFLHQFDSSIFRSELQKSRRKFFKISFDSEQCMWYGTVAIENLSPLGQEKTPPGRPGGL